MQHHSLIWRRQRTPAWYAKLIARI